MLLHYNAFNASAIYFHGYKLLKEHLPYKGIPFSYSLDLIIIKSDVLFKILMHDLFFLTAQ